MDRHFIKRRYPVDSQHVNKCALLVTRKRKLTPQRFHNTPNMRLKL